MHTLNRQNCCPTFVFVQAFGRVASFVLSQQRSPATQQTDREESASCTCPLESPSTPPFVPNSKGKVRDKPRRKDARSRKSVIPCGQRSLPSYSSYRLGNRAPSTAGGLVYGIPTPPSWGRPIVAIALVWGVPSKDNVTLLSHQLFTSLLDSDPPPFPIPFPCNPPSLSFL